MSGKVKICALLVFFSALFVCAGSAQQIGIVSGNVVGPRSETVSKAAITIETTTGDLTITTDGDGFFRTPITGRVIALTVSGKSIATASRKFGFDDRTDGLRIKVDYVVPPITESVTIHADSLTPQIEYRDQTLYDNSLFARDDQLIQTLNAGINAGQHEGGGKSLELRRYGFNLDHGGGGGGLKILVDNVQQNQGTQGHGQGYLGALKSLSPELVEDVSIINGPFSAVYGDFSGLGVVQIRQRETLPQIFTARVQGGSLNTFRGFFAASPAWKNIDSFIAYEPSYTDGPFDNKLRYRRHNITGNFTYKFDARRALSLKTNFGRNDFTSSGQLPLDVVESGGLSRWSFIDPDGGGKSRSGTVAIYYGHDTARNGTFKADAFVARSLLDLFSNFTFFLADPVYGDEIQQHDSRLQEGANVQYLRPYKFFGSAALLTAGGNLHLNQINVGLYPSFSRDPRRKSLPRNENNRDVLLTSARAGVNNYAGYLQNEFNFFRGKLHIDLGLRYDYFTFQVDGFEQSDELVILKGRQGEGAVQPKASVAVSPFQSLPITLYANYGRGISSQDARGVVRDQSSRRLAATDFYQMGASYSGRTFSAVFSSFVIDRSNEHVYIPDDGSIEVAGPTRSYGVEVRSSIRITDRISFNGGLTQVIKAFYRDEFVSDGSRRIVDSAPRLIANAGFVFSEFRGFNASIAWRHVSNYRLDPDDRAVRASGNDVVDVSVSRRLTRWLDANLAIDNLLNKQYFETQNYFESRICPSCDARTRIHATPGYPFTVVVGATVRLGRKN